MIGATFPTSIPLDVCRRENAVALNYCRGESLSEVGPRSDRHECAPSAVRREHNWSLPPAPGQGKIFLDYLRNGRGNTAIGAYSPRAHPNFPIACPVSWSQVEKGIPPDAFTMRH